MAETTPAKYKMVPLRSDIINVSVVQSRVLKVDADNPEKGKQENLKHMLNLIDLVQSFGVKDLLVFHEFPLAAMSFEWNRKQALGVAIDVPGPETEAIGQKAKKYNCYIEFGSYAKLPDWPGHFTNMGIMVGPKGDVIYKHWKSRNMSGMGFSTTIYDVLDDYVEKYGWDAVFPIAYTDIGNICTIPEVNEPEQGRIFAMKGAEIVIRYMTAGAGTSVVSPFTWLGGPNEHTFRTDFQAQCIQGQYYGVFVNNSVSLMGDSEFDLGGGHSAIFDPNGRILMEASTIGETLVASPINMATFRKYRSVPTLPKDLYMNFWQNYVPRFPANAFKQRLPDSIMDSAALYKKIANW